MHSSDAACQVVRCGKTLMHLVFFSAGNKCHLSGQQFGYSEEVAGDGGSLEEVTGRGGSLEEVAVVVGAVEAVAVVDGAV
jgi:hypothetical protein